MSDETPPTDGEESGVIQGPWSSDAPPDAGPRGAAIDDDDIRLAMGSMLSGAAPGVNAAQLARLDRNDLGNGQRYAARAAGRLLFVDKKPIGWTGAVWSGEDGQFIAERLAHETAAEIFNEAAAIESLVALRNKAGDKTKAEALAKLIGPLRKHALNSGDLGRLNAMRNVAAPLLAARRDSFDVQPEALNCANGVLTWKFADGSFDVLDFTLADHDPAARMTRITAVAYNPGATAPEWTRHLEKVLPDPDVRAYFQTVIGYLLTGYTREQCIFMLHGKGGDGKSTTMNVIRRMLGTYAVAADVKTFLEGGSRGGAEASPDMARLAGDVRLVSTGEPSRGSTLNEGLIKAFSGGAPIVTRELHGNPFEFTPRGKVVIEFNPRPRIRGDDDGIWRRIRIIPFPVQLKEQADKSYENRLMTEVEGVLNWALEGLTRYLAEGLREPDAVRAAIDDYRRGSNPFGDWWSDRIVEEAGARTLAKDLFDDFTMWCEANGVKAMTSTAFGRALGDRQIIVVGKDSKGRKYRGGVRLVDDDLTRGPHTPPPSSARGKAGRREAEASRDYKGGADDAWIATGPHSDEGEPDDA